MEFNVNDKDKILEIWLSNSEKEDISLKSLYKEYKEKKYTVAVFKSGNENLFSNTKELLLNNRKM